MDHRPEDASGAEQDPNRNAKGQWARGNTARRSHGLYSKVPVSRSERRRVLRMRRVLEDQGMLREVAEDTAWLWYSARRIISDYAAAGFPADQREDYFRAQNIVERVARRLDAAAPGRTNPADVDVLDMDDDELGAGGGR